MRAPRGWHDSVETCRSVLIYKFIVIVPFVAYFTKYSEVFIQISAALQRWHRYHQPHVEWTCYIFSTWINELPKLLNVSINASKPVNFIRPYGCSERTLVMKIIASTFPATSTQVFLFLLTENLIAHKTKEGNLRLLIQPVGRATLIV